MSTPTEPHPYGNYQATLKRTIVFSLLAMLILLASSARPASAALVAQAATASDWKYQAVAHDGVGGVSNLNAPNAKLNDKGEAAFRACIDGQCGIYVWSQGTTSPFALAGDAVPNVGPQAKFTDIGIPLFLDNAGAVIFFASVEETPGSIPISDTYRGDADGFHRILLPSETDTLFDIHNTNGEWLKFQVTFPSAGTEISHFTATNGLADSSSFDLVTRQDSAGSQQETRVLAIDNTGGFVFSRSTKTGNGSQGTFTTTFERGGTLSGLIAQTSGSFSFSDGCFGTSSGLIISSLVVNTSLEDGLYNTSTQCNVEPGVQTLVKKTLTAETELANSNTSIFKSFAPVRLADDGTPIFAATMDDDSSAFFVGPDPASDRVVVPFETLFGQTGTPDSMPSDNREGDFLIAGHLLDGSALLVLGFRSNQIVWTNPAGGDWSLAGNWLPNTVPGQGQATGFILDGTYDVNVGSRQVGNVNVENGSLAFTNAALDITGKLQVGNQAVLSLPAGSMQTGDTTLGFLPPADLNALLTAHLNLINTGTLFTNTGTLRIGNAAPGELFLSNGAHAITGETLVGDGADGTLITGGAGTLLEAGNVAVGVNTFNGTLTVEEGADLFADSLSVGQLGSLTFNGPAINPADGTFVSIKKSLVIGSSPAVNTGNASMFMEGGAEVNVGAADGNLIVGDVREGLLVIRGMNPVTNDRTRLVIENIVDAPNTAICFIGGFQRGEVDVIDGAALGCNEMDLGSELGGVGDLELNAGDPGLRPVLVTVTRTLTIGGSSAGAAISMNNATVKAGKLLLRPTGRIDGNGTLEIGPDGAIIEGSLSPGVVQFAPAPRSTSSSTFFQAATAVSQAATAQPATLTVSGSATFNPSAQVNLDVPGPASHDKLIFTGNVTLSGGTLVVTFGNGYLPQKGDSFELLTAGSLSGAFDSVTVLGLPDGYILTPGIAAGKLTLEVTEAAPPPQHLLFLPLVLK
jgi:hypothetical protein